MRQLDVSGSAAAARRAASDEMFKHVFLTGPPGVGKTTLVQKACEALVSSGTAVGGFYTEEVREGGRRVGFDVVTVTGERAHLSRVRDLAAPSGGGREYAVGQYVVDLASFEKVALPLFRNVSLKLALIKRSQ
ncbi:ntpcr [Pungitius sinensis]